MGEIFYLPQPKELTPEQVDHWLQVLENAERMRENALRVLGKLGVEKGLDNDTI